MLISGRDRHHSSGVLAGYFGGRVDMVVNFIITTRLSLPVVLVALAVVSLIGSSLTVVIWVLGLLIWDRFAVVMRSATHAGTRSRLTSPPRHRSAARPGISFFRRSCPTSPTI